MAKFLDRFRSPKLASPSITLAQWARTDWRTVAQAPLNIVVGEQHYVEGIRDMIQTKLDMQRWRPPPYGFFVPVVVEFWREPDNAYDTNAWVAIVSDQQVGHLRAVDAEVAANLCDVEDVSMFSYAGVVRGKDPVGIHVWPDYNLTVAPRLKGEGASPVGWPSTVRDGRTKDELDEMGCPSCGKWPPYGVRIGQTATCGTCGDIWTPSSPN